MNRLLPVLCVVAVGCSTVTPMQTASVVAPQTFRLGGQLTAAGFCGNAGEGGLGVLRCADFPDGVPTPELRASGRAGIAKGFDLGLSVFGFGQLLAPERVATFGMTLDGKAEVLRIKASDDVSHVFSAGLLFGAATSFRTGLQGWGQLDWGVPLFYGLQLRHWEFVLGSTISTRNLDAAPPSPDVMVPRLSFSLGLYQRAPAGIALQLAYFTDPRAFTLGALQLQVGLFWDLKR